VRVLYCGDTQVDTIISSKGFDTFTHSYFRDGSHILRDALSSAGIECDHMPADRVRSEFPGTADELAAAYDVVILSDVGYNNFALLPGNRPPLAVPLGASRPIAIRDYVANGGGLIMAGGWLSFSGLEGKGIYGGTLIEEALPVTCLRGQDDRAEVSEGVRFTIDRPEHELVAGLPWDDPYLVVGYNRVQSRPEATVVASLGPDPALVVWEYVKGRSLVYVVDPSTHWGGTFLSWSAYGEFWGRLVRWTAGQPVQQ